MRLVMERPDGRTSFDRLADADLHYQEERMVGSDIGDDWWVGEGGERGENGCN